MSLSKIAYLYFARLKSRAMFTQEALAIGGIAIGVALLFAAQIASATLNGSVEQLTSGVIGDATYQLVARSPTGFSETLLGRMRRLPGVERMVPVLEQQAIAVGPKGIADVDLLASAPRYVRLAGPLLSRFSEAQLANQQGVGVTARTAKIIGAGAFEGPARLMVNGRYSAVLIAAELNQAEVGPLARSPIVIAPLAYAQKLTGMSGKLTRIFVLARLGKHTQVHAELARFAGDHHLNLHSADFDATLFSRAAGPVNQSTSTFAFICALVGFAFAYCAMLLTINLRREFVRELRRNGTTRLETVKTLLFDAFVLGVFASAVGLALGDILSFVVFGSNPGYLAFAFPIGSGRIIPWQSAVYSVAVALLAAGVGVLTPISDIWGHAPADVRWRGPLTGRWAATMVGVGMACLAGTTLILVLAPQRAVLGVVVLLVALVLLLLPLADIAASGFGRLAQSFGRGAMAIAVAELRDTKAQLRSVAIAGTAAIAVFAGVTIQDSHANLQHGIDRLVAQLSAAADIWVLQPGQQNTLATTPFSDAYRARIGRVAGVRSVGSYRAGFLDIGDRRTWVLAPPWNATDPIPPSQIITGNEALSTARLRAGGWAVVSQVLASEQHLHIGERFSLPTANPITVRLAATITNLGWPPGAIILSSAEFVHAWGSAAPTAYNVQIRRGASVEHVASEIRAALGPSALLTVQTRHQREMTQINVSKQGLGRLTQIAILVLLAGILATVVSMGQAIWQRRQRYARMKFQGVATTTLWAALVWESVVLIGSGCLAGAIIGIYGQLLLSHALIVVTGFPVIVSLGLPFALAGFVVVTLLAAAMIAIVGNRAANVEPIPTTRVTRAEQARKAATIGVS